MTQEQHDYEMGCAAQAQAEYEMQCAAQAQADVSRKIELLIALQRIEKICDNQNPTHEEIWRIAYGAINSQ